MQIARIGLDLAKYVFEIHGVDCHGKTVLRRTLRRDAVTTFFANLPPCLVGMEASNGADYLQGATHAETHRSGGRRSYARAEAAHEIHEKGFANEVWRRRRGPGHEQQ